MKTINLISAFASFSLACLLSFTAIADSTSYFTGNLSNTVTRKNDSAEKWNNIQPSAEIFAEKEFNYLRFDVSKYINEGNTEITELPETDEFGYLRFDVGSYIDENESEILDLPASNEFDYLRFDVRKYIGTNSLEIGELPGAE